LDGQDIHIVTGYEVEKYPALHKHELDPGPIVSELEGHCSHSTLPAVEYMLLAQGKHRDPAEYIPAGHSMEATNSEKIA
jgi:hypothetical protein